MLGRGILALTCVAALCVPAAASAAKRSSEPLSARVEHVGTLPAPAGIGANFKDGYMFVTGTSGLWVYDVTDADDPQLVSQLPLPHYESEDVSIGGDRLLISGDGTAGSSTLFVIDISNPEQPRVERAINMQLLDEGHTATCILDCHYVWVAGGGTIAVLNLEELDQVETPDPLPDIQVQGASTKVEVGDLATAKEFGWSTHDVQVDNAGYAWVVGGDGTVAFDTRPGSYPVPGKPYPQNLLEPKVVARTGPDARNDGDFFESDESNNADTLNDFIHHNSWRPDASGFSSRKSSQMRKRGVRDGELVLITEEDIWNRPSMGTAPGGCETQGSFQTWQMKQLGAPDENTSTVKNLDSWTTEFNEAVEGDDLPNGQDAIPTKGFCSSHYFTEQDGIVATAWYEQGTRFLDVSDPANIKQVGYFVAPGSTTWAAYWSPTDRNVVYAIDNNRGIDVLRFNRSGAARAERRGSARVKAPLARWWFRKSSAGATPHPKFSWPCRLPK